MWLARSWNECANLSLSFLETTGNLTMKLPGRFDGGRGCLMRFLRKSFLGLASLPSPLSIAWRRNILAGAALNSNLGNSNRSTESGKGRAVGRCCGARMLLHFMKTALDLLRVQKSR